MKAGYQDHRESRLRSLQRRAISALQLIWIMYARLKQFEPGMDNGVNLGAGVRDGGEAGEGASHLYDLYQRSYSLWPPKQCRM